MRISGQSTYPAVHAKYSSPFTELNVVITTCMEFWAVWGVIYLLCLYFLTVRDYSYLTIPFSSIENQSQVLAQKTI